MSSGEGRFSLPLLALVCSAVIVLTSPGIAWAGSVIPPAWAAHPSNPCASVSWQQVLWPEDGRCYPIFRRGPCPETQELVWEQQLHRPVCVCPRDGLLHADTGVCYRRHSRGPCPPRHFYSDQQDADDGPSTSSSPSLVQPRCRPFAQCPAGQVYWPRTGGCHRYLSRGPCSNGELLFVNASSLEPQCGCHSGLMARSYWIHTDSCYEEHTRGPCPRGLVFIYNMTRGAAQCTCHPNMLENFHRFTGQCHALGTRGPCPLGGIFSYNNATRMTQCRCPADALIWPPTGECHHAYTQGPCATGEFLAPAADSSQDDPEGHCVPNPCRRGELFFPEDDVCHRIGRRGRCELGELVMYEEYRGISYRGACGCTQHFTHNYWTPDERCYQLYTRGPCPPLFTFVYNQTAAEPQCVCDGRRGRALYRDSGQCHELFKRGPCPPDQTLVRTMQGTVQCSCRQGHVFDTRRDKCLPDTEVYKSLTMVRILR